MRFACGLAVLVASAVLGGPAHAVVWTVDDNGPADFASIQAAINAATNGDEIVVRAGRYRETLSFQGKALTVRSESGPSNTVVFLEGETRIVLLNGSSTLRGFTITGGRARVGGGIRVTDGAQAVVEDNVVENNVAERDGSGFPSFGAGIAVDGGAAPLITRNVIRGNLATGDAQGLYAYGGGIDIGDDTTAVVTNNVFSGNRATDSGGAISVGVAGLTVPVAIEHNTIVGNEAGDGVANSVSFGGGILLSDGVEAVVRNNVMADNVARFDGGGIYFFGNGLQTITYAANAFDTNLPNNCGGLASNRCNGGQVFQPASFEDEAAGRYRLRSDSALIDAGASPTGPTVDADGRARSADGNLDGSPAPDPGAFENQGEQTGLRFTSIDILVWDDSANPSVTFEVYREDLALLGPGALGTCAISGLPTPTWTDSTPPPSATGLYYLVRGVGTVDGSLGFDSAGAERTPAVVCP